MYRIVSAILVGVATLLFIRGTQIDRQIWQAAESRKALLEHYVDHTRTLTPRDIEEKRFWSNYGDYPEKFSFYYFLGAIFVVSLTQLSNKLCARQKKLA